MMICFIHSNWRDWDWKRVLNFLTLCWKRCPSTSLRFISLINHNLRGGKIIMVVSLLSNIRNWSHSNWIRIIIIDRDKCRAILCLSCNAGSRRFFGLWFKRNTHRTSSPPWACSTPSNSMTLRNENLSFSSRQVIFINFWVSGHNMSISVYNYFFGKLHIIHNHFCGTSTASPRTRSLTVSQDQQKKTDGNFPHLSIKFYNRTFDSPTFKLHFIIIIVLRTLINSKLTKIDNFNNFVIFNEYLHGSLDSIIWPSYHGRWAARHHGP